MCTHTGDEKERQRIKYTRAKLRDLQGVRECREHGDKSEVVETEEKKGRAILFRAACT
jgi:hypothetical protein